MKKRSVFPGVVLLVAGLVLLTAAALQYSGALTPVALAPAPTVLATVVAALRPATATPLVVLTPLPTETEAPTEELIAAETETSVPTLAPIATLAPAPRVVNVGQGARPVKIAIPAISVRANVVEMGWTNVVENGQPVSEWNVPKNDVGHVMGSANPGERGNVVLSGHNNLYAAVFRKLYTLAVGDEITIYNLRGQGFVYRVSQSYIVKEAGVPPEERQANARVLLPTADARVTLTSCWPETSNTHRAIVIALLSGTVQ